MADPAAGHQTVLRPVRPFDFGQSLHFLRGFAPCADDYVCTAQRLLTGGYVEERPFIVRVTAEHAGAALAVAIEWRRSPGDPHGVHRWLTRFLSLDDDLQPLYAAATEDPAFARVVEALYGYHHVRFPTAFEAACWAALSQRTPWQVSLELKQKLVRVAGETVQVDDAQIALFPTPARMLANRSAVEEAIAHERKAKTLMAAAGAFLAEDLHALDDSALLGRLNGIWGFGAWSTEFVALRGFGRLHRIPTTERRLREAVATLYGLDKPQATEADLARLSARYGPYAGYWAHYIRVWVHRHG